MKQNILFVSDLVDGSEFRTLRKTRYFLYTILMFYAFVYFLMVLQKDLETPLFVHIISDIPVASMLMLMLLSAILFVYYLSFKRASMGVLEISETGITFNFPEKTTFKSFDQIERLKIVRGSTYHYNYQEKNAIIKVNNFIEYDEGNDRHKHEFEIDSEMKNQMFEEMIDKLSHEKVKFEYLSI